MTPVDERRLSIVFPCEKKRYETQDQAKKALRSCRAKGWPQIRYYRCPRCDGWHLTSKPFKPKESEK